MARLRRHKPLEMSLTFRKGITRQIAERSLVNKEPTSLNFKVKELEAEHELAIHARVVWAKNLEQSRCTKRCDNDMFLAWLPMGKSVWT